MTYTEHLKWLITMAKTPGWREYVWARAKELDADRSGLWTGIAADLERAMLSQKSAGAVLVSGG